MSAKKDLSHSVRSPVRFFPGRAGRAVLAAEHCRFRLAVDDDLQIEPVFFLIDGSGSFFTGSQRGFTWHRSYLSSVTMVCDFLLLP